MVILGSQITAARGLLNLTQTEVAKFAGIHVNTLRDMERTHMEPVGGKVETLNAVLGVLEGRGVEFLNHGQPGVRMRARI